MFEVHYAYDRALNKNFAVQMGSLNEITNGIEYIEAMRKQRIQGFQHSILDMNSFRNFGQPVPKPSMSKWRLEPTLVEQRAIVHPRVNMDKVVLYGN